MSPLRVKQALTYLEAGLCIAAFTAFPSCTTRSRVVAQSAAGIDLSRYKTFAIQTGQIKTGDVVRPGNQVPRGKVLEAALREELQRRGLHEATEDPDLTFTYLAERRGGEAGDHGGKFQEGAFVLDAIDTHSKQVVWRAHAQAVIDPKAASYEQLKTAVKKAFRDFPDLPKQ